MFETKEEQALFCEEFNISQVVFYNSMLTWESLDRIFKHYNEIKENDCYEDIAQSYATKLRQCSRVHSIRCRVKDPLHLIEKIIRKNQDYLGKGNCLSVDNYRKHITDIIGVRALLLFKEDWDEVHDYIVQHFGDMFLEHPFVYLRKGDSRELYEGKIEIRERDTYRAAHYILQTDKGVCIEIQVRTLYEEAWSEVDHKLRYPYDMSNEMLTAYINIMNRITGIADEMGTFIHDYISAFQSCGAQRFCSENEFYNYIYDAVERSADSALKEDIQSKIVAMQNYKKLEDFSELIRDFMKGIN